MTMEQRDWAGVFSAITTPFAATSRSITRSFASTPRGSSTAAAPGSSRLDRW
jgi:hypothetical protein